MQLVLLNGARRLRRWPMNKFGAPQAARGQGSWQLQPVARGAVKRRGRSVSLDRVATW